MADVMSFDISLIKMMKSQEKLDKQQTHLKRRLSEDITVAKRPM